MIRCTDNECWLDPRRIFNQDETSLTAGSEHERVLAPVGYQRPIYHLSGDSRVQRSHQPLYHHLRGWKIYWM